MSSSDYLSQGAQVMGILNLTPDSFSDGGLYNQLENALAHARQMMVDGATIIDIGGESTRPGSKSVGAEEQIRRILPVIRALKTEDFDDRSQPLISVDTTLSRVAYESVRSGASWINDVSAGRGDPDMYSVVAELGVPMVLMHMQGVPETMQIDPSYVSVVDEVLAFLEARIELAIRAGIEAKNILIDPGIGFGKSRDHNLMLLGSLDRFVASGFPVVLGCSRKRFMGKICHEEDPRALLGSTVATTALGVLAGVKVFRVHDVKPNRQAIDVMQAVTQVGSARFKSR